MLHFIWQIIWKPLTNYAIKAIIGRRDQECFEGFFISCEMNLLFQGLWLNELCPVRSWPVHFKWLYLMSLLSLQWDQESSNVSSSLGFYPASFLALPPRLCLYHVAWIISNSICVTKKNKKISCVSLPEVVYKVLHDIHLVWGNVVERNCAVTAAGHSLFHGVLYISAIFQ